MDELTTKFEVKTSRNDLPIPVLNGIHLHSIYNPIKEAEAFVEKNLDTIKQNNSFLVLGLGFAYHVEAILKASPFENTKIMVVEPNSKLVQAFFQNRELSSSAIIVKNYETVESYFFDYDFINFLMKKPSLLKHDTSFNLEVRFFKKLLSYQCSNNISHYQSILDPSWETYFSNIDKNQTLLDLSQALKRKQALESQDDYLVLALSEIKKMTSNF